MKERNPYAALPVVGDWGTEPSLPLFDEEAALAAMRGQDVPSSLDDADLHPTMLLCIIRGIRHHPAFAQGVRRHSGASRHPALVRALNARDIMSNVIPDMAGDDEVPYCFWHPDVASEATYRALAERYPRTRYQVGRACAVAGYASLWKDLNLLPDISHAEEARDNMAAGGSSQPIFDAIMEQPVKWLVMNDYLRTVALDHPLPARYGLNGDTAVRSTLDIRRGLDSSGGFKDGWGELSSPSLNITEDCSVDDHDTFQDLTSRDELSAVVDDDMAVLLWEPLPVDLPRGNKDILILMAAYNGDIDRFVRLRRPASCSFLPQEAACIINGIYRSTMFAKWWSTQPDNEEYQSAINARFIMNNDVSRITPDMPPYALPHMIWYPARACADTYLQVARINSRLAAVAARAAVVANYEDLWDSLVGDVEPSIALLAEASVSPNPRYVTDLQRRAAELGLELTLPPAGPYLIGLQCVNHTINHMSEATSTVLFARITPGDVLPAEGVLQASSANAGTVNLFACAPQTLRLSAAHGIDLETLYYEKNQN